MQAELSSNNKSQNVIYQCEVLRFAEESITIAVRISRYSTTYGSAAGLSIEASRKALSLQQGIHV